MESQEIDDLLQTPGELSYTISDAALMKQVYSQSVTTLGLDHFEKNFLGCLVHFQMLLLFCGSCRVLKLYGFDVHSS